MGPADIWTNDGKSSWRIYVSFGLNELMCAVYPENEINCFEIPQKYFIEYTVCGSVVLNLGTFGTFLLS